MKSLENFPASFVSPAVLWVGTRKYCENGGGGGGGGAGRGGEPEGAGWQEGCAHTHLPGKQHKRNASGELTKTCVASLGHWNYITLSPHGCLLLLFVFQNVPVNSKRSAMFP